MIYDKLENLETYEGISPRVMQGLKLLRDTNFSALEDGKHIVDGDNLYFSLQSYDTKVNELAEAHRKYIDIQYLLEGEEEIGVAGLSDMGEPVESKPEKDVWKYAGDMKNLRLGNGYFVVLWPQDAHAPCRMIDEPKHVHKVVVKVLA